MRQYRFSPLVAFSSLVLMACATNTFAAPTVTRLNPPSRLFAGDKTPGPTTARFLMDQRFDLQATVVADAGQKFTRAVFSVDGTPVGPEVTTFVPADGKEAPTNGFSVAYRAYSNSKPGVHTFSITATQADGKTATATGDFEIVAQSKGKNKAKNVIYLIGDGMGIAHRTAARIILRGSVQGKSSGLLTMDTFPNVALVMTASLNSVVTDSAPGAHCYSTGNKTDNNEEGVFPDDTADKFDNARVENIGEYLHRKQGKALGIVTTADVFDATPAAFGIHTQDRGAGTGIVDQYLAEADKSGLQVLMGGGRKWFLPEGTLGSARTAASDYVLGDDIANGWKVPKGARDPKRDAIADWQEEGFDYASDKTSLDKTTAANGKLLGLFAFGNMNVAKDKIDGRRKATTVVSDFGFPDQPMLDEMATKALDVLSKNKNGFVLMIEGASIDKQSHNMDPERSLLDVIEFDRAIAVCKAFAEKNGDTLVVVTADHECSGLGIIGASKVSTEELKQRASGNADQAAGVKNLRDGVVGVYEEAGFPHYTIAPDGYPVTTDPDRKLLLSFAANADRYEDWLTNPLPLQDSQQPLVKESPLNTHPAGPTKRDTAGNFFVTGQVPGSVATHTGTDIPLSAFGRGATLFGGVIDNTEVFFRVMQAVLQGEH